MIGGALGGVERCSAGKAPGSGRFSMGAILGGTMRSPLTGVIFALELTHDVNVLLPLLLAVTIAHGFTVLVLRRSILTEKVAGAAIHLSREYAIDPLEILFAREVARTGHPRASVDRAVDVASALATTRSREAGVRGAAAAARSAPLPACRRG